MKSIKKEIRKELHIRLAHNLAEFETHIFSEKSLENVEWETADEFLFEGYKYDVFKTTIIAGITYFHCVKDKKETIVDKYISFFKTSKPVVRKHQNQFLKNLRIKCLKPLPHTLQNFLANMNLHSSYKESYQYLNWTRISDPPDEI